MLITATKGGNFDVIRGSGGNRHPHHRHSRPAAAAAVRYGLLFSLQERVKHTSALSQNRQPMVVRRGGFKWPAVHKSSPLGTLLIGFERASSCIELSSSVLKVEGGGGGEGEGEEFCSSIPARPGGERGQEKVAYLSQKSLIPGVILLKVFVDRTENKPKGGARRRGAKANTLFLLFLGMLFYIGSSQSEIWTWLEGFFTPIHSTDHGLRRRVTRLRDNEAA